MTVIPVVAGAAHYDVVVGPLESACEHLAALGPAILVSEPRVFALHRDRLDEHFGGGVPILLPEGEAAKQWDVLHRLLTELAERSATRSTPIIAVGGGSIGDLAGLAASLFKRGCPVVHVPTTLLAQADSAVGGKAAAMNALGEKNLVGTFHQPSLVVADPAFLDTLDPRQLRSGYAEIVKYGLIDDAPFFAWCEANGAALLAGDPDLRHRAIVTAVTAKARLIAGDVEDRAGQRALLNFGHSFAHAIESAAGIGNLLHGEAVAVGMVMALCFSHDHGFANAAAAKRLAAHLGAVGLPASLDDVGVRPAALLPWIARDKKNNGDGLTLVLARGIGQAFVARGVNPDRLARFLS